MGLTEGWCMCGAPAKRPGEYHSAKGCTRMDGWGVPELYHSDECWQVHGHHGCARVKVRELQAEIVRMRDTPR